MDLKFSGPGIVCAAIDLIWFYLLLTRGEENHDRTVIIRYACAAVQVDKFFFLCLPFRAFS